MEYLSNVVRNDLIVDAVELGSNYWYVFGKPASTLIKKHLGIQRDFHGDFFYGTFAEAILTTIMEGNSIPVHDVETGELGEFSKESIEKGEKIMAEQYPEYFNDILNENSDAGTADVWFQLCVMGEIVFG